MKIQSVNSYFTMDKANSSVNSQAISSNDDNLRTNSRLSEPIDSKYLKTKSDKNTAIPNLDDFIENLEKRLKMLQKELSQIQAQKTELLGRKDTNSAQMLKFILTRETAVIAQIVAIQAAILKAMQA